MFRQRQRASGFPPVEGKSGVSWQTAIVKADEEDDAFSKTRKVHSSFDGEVRRMLESEEKR